MERGGGDFLKRLSMRQRDSVEEVRELRFSQKVLQLFRLARRRVFQTLPTDS